MVHFNFRMQKSYNSAIFSIPGQEGVYLPTVLGPCKDVSNKSKILL